MISVLFVCYCAATDPYSPTQDPRTSQPTHITRSPNCLDDGLSLLQGLQPTAQALSPPSLLAQAMVPPLVPESSCAVGSRRNSSFSQDQSGRVMGPQGRYSHTQGPRTSQPTHISRPQYRFGDKLPSSQVPESSCAIAIGVLLPRDHPVVLVVDGYYYLPLR